MAEHLLSNRLPIVATIDPDAYTTGAQLSDAIAMTDHRRLQCIVLGGVIASSGTLDFKLQEATGATGTYSDISGKSITQWTTANNNNQAVINLSADELGAGKTHVKMSLTLTTAGGDQAAIAIAGESRFSDAVNTTAFGDLASVAQIVA